jgi:hypothetical protein
MVMEAGADRRRIGMGAACTQLSFSGMSCAAYDSHALVNCALRPPPRRLTSLSRHVSVRYLLVEATARDSAARACRGRQRGACCAQHSNTRAVMLRSRGSAPTAGDDDSDDDVDFELEELPDTDEVEDADASSEGAAAYEPEGEQGQTSAVGNAPARCTRCISVKNPLMFCSAVSAYRWFAGCLGRWLVCICVCCWL